MYWAMALPFVGAFVAPFAEALRMFDPEQFAAAGGNPDAGYAAGVSLLLFNLVVGVALFQLAAWPRRTEFICVAVSSERACKI
jgi:hypothetical protein